MKKATSALVVTEASDLGKQVIRDPRKRGGSSPACAASSVFSLCMNCGGTQWRLGDVCGSRLSATEEAAFIRHAQKYGFHTHSVAGMLDRGERPRGGVMLFDFGNLRGMPQDAQVASVWVEDLFLLTFYAPPDRSKDCQQLGL